MNALVDQAGFAPDRFTILTPRAQAAFLEHLAHSGNVRLACWAASVSPQTAYRARRVRPAFAALWDAPPIGDWSDPGLAEAMQLAAFEAGMDNWWLAGPVERH